MKQLAKGVDATGDGVAASSSSSVSTYRHLPAMPFGCLDASASSLKVEKRLGDGFIELKEEIDPRGNGQTLLSIGLMRLAAASWSWLPGWLQPAVASFICGGANLPRRRAMRFANHKSATVEVWLAHLPDKTIHRDEVVTSKKEKEKPLFLEHMCRNHPIR
jgi:hypothetical protein